MLNQPAKKIYMIGIKGTGMSSLAVLLKKLDYKVTGSDTAEKFFTEAQLKNDSIPYFEVFDAKNIVRQKPDLVVASTAYGENHPEIAKAKNLEIETISYPEMVGRVSKSLNSIAVCGSHGKTTTTSMLGYIMEENGQTLTLTGTVAENLNTKKVNPKFFVFEADEYQNKFRYYLPNKAILTNIDFDHPDFFKNKKYYAKTFKDFTVRILKNKGFILFNFDNAAARKLFKSLNGDLSSYGFHKNSDFQVKNINQDLNSFSIFYKNKELINLELEVYGKHNILNAAASAIMALKCGIKKGMIRKKLKKFGGVKRRMELIPNPSYIVIDDYGHHPTEISATLAAVRNKYPDKKIITVFHPHTFSRTQALFREFGKCFKNSDLTIVLDIYASARENVGKIHSKDLVKEIKNNGQKAIYHPNIAEATKYVKNKIKKGSLILTIGAGDVWKMKDLL